MSANWMLFAVLLAIILFALLVKRMCKPSEPSFFVTRIPKLFSQPGFKAYFAKNSTWLLWGALLFCAFALSDPKIAFSTKKLQESTVQSGIGLYYLLDQSGSMEESIESQNGNKITKIDLAKTAIIGDLAERKEDLVGLIAFARAARVLCPLTLDHSALADRLDAVTPIQKESQNGTAIGYAIFKAVNLFVATNYFSERLKEKERPVYAIDKYALVIITDGLQSPHPEDRKNPFRFIPIDEAVRFAKQNSVRVYFIGIDPVFKRNQFQNAVSEIKSTVESTGGRFFITSDLSEIQGALSDIKTIEKSAIVSANQGESSSQLYSVQLLCTQISLLLLGLAMLSETVFFRRLP